jgi:hypothetical protein
MAFSALSALVAQHGFAKMEEAFQILREQEEILARGRLLDTQEQILPADSEPAVVPAEVVSSTPRRARLSAETSFELASEEEIQQITRQIDEGHLRHERKGLNWNPGARHHPASERQKEIIAVLRAQESRSVTKAQLMEKLSPRWSWNYHTGLSPAGQFIGELVKQGIVKIHN